MEPVVDEEASGYFELLVEGVPPGTRYTYIVDGNNDLPDPASRFQPDGVHGPSAVVDTAAFDWTDEHWTGIPLRNYVIYELHIGTFSESGTFEGVIPHLEELSALGITAIEIMPVAQFPGNRNWGYDGTYPFAAQNSYGGPAGLCSLVDAAHAHQIAVVLDVVYNHLGPEGNYLNNFGPYFSDRYRTPWGSAVNFDGEQSDEVRHYFIENARYWLEDLHLDALRLDAIHSIFDQSANPFLRELASDVHRGARERGRHAYLIAESDLNDPRVIEPPAINGFGLDAQWNDDFHHAVEVYLIGQQSMRAADFGSFTDIVRAYRDGYVYSGQYSPARRRRHGVPLQHAQPDQLVVFMQNHDQIGNRLNGERLSLLLPFDALKLCAAAMMLSPYIPLLFMGEEYGETAPFLYFTSHADASLIKAVREGRANEFGGMWSGEPPDPQSPKTLADSRLSHRLVGEGQHRVLRDFYGELLRLRRDVLNGAAERFAEPGGRSIDEEETITLQRIVDDRVVYILLNFGGEPADVDLGTVPKALHKLLNSDDLIWDGSGREAPELVDVTSGAATLSMAPRSCLVYASATSTSGDSESNLDR